MDLLAFKDVIQEKLRLLFTLIKKMQHGMEVKKTFKLEIEAEKNTKTCVLCIIQR